jgi:hypothetical protein
MKKNGMNLAFAVTNYKTNEPLQSGEFVEWEIYFERRENL